MGYMTSFREEPLEEIAQIMSEKADCNVPVDEIRLDFCTANVSVFRARILKLEEDRNSAITIICAVHYPEKRYEVQKY